MTTLVQLLGTKKKGEQIERIKALMQAANAQVMAVMVVMDPRTGRIDVRAGGVENADVESIKYVLRQAIDLLTVQAVSNQKAPVGEGPPRSGAVASEPAMPFPEEEPAIDPEEEPAIDPEEEPAIDPDNSPGGYRPPRINRPANNPT
jgi:hypothetical protein